MIHYYLLLFVAVIIGQSFFASIVTWYYQRNNPMISYRKAFGIYLKKEVGTFIVITCFTLLLMFILSDYMDLTKTRAELIAKGKLNRFESIQKSFRTYAVIYGVFAQFFAVLFYKGGIKAITDFGKEKGIDVEVLQNDKK